MRAVGIKVLKAKLSEYVRRAKEGETILVTERDEVVAELRPARREQPGVRDLDTWFAELAEIGEASLASESPRDWTGLTVRRRIEKVSSDALLDELRRDGQP